MNVYWTLNINDLKAVCESKGLSILGSRGELVERLTDAFPLEDNIIKSIRATGDFYKGQNAIIIRSGKTGGCSGCKK
jgi:SAP domain